MRKNDGETIDDGPTIYAEAKEQEKPGLSTNGEGGAFQARGYWYWAGAAEAAQITNKRGPRSL
ncbi:hypothetical protein KTAU_42520 [Thermogemmatispora aurantia]|uniref:Uncharacterized protein n=1 Tax=Thermogemmatispora aurantia TaxID=2045279 RepID=A0A5J4KAQ9_9CHLR|nr:hypothetical protein KTAU_42520 [Thermogemmatispora aurantia]